MKQSHESLAPNHHVDAQRTPRHTGHLTLLALLAFAANSLLCRLALKGAHIDPASFTAVRLAAGALTLAMIVRLRGGTVFSAGNWVSSLALFVYAAGFSYAYVGLTAATGALLLFGAVQGTMLGYGRWQGHRLGTLQVVGIVSALAGLVQLLIPGLAAPPLRPAILMLGAGVAWGAYSLRGAGGGDPTRETAGNFVRAALPACAWIALTLPSAFSDRIGIAYAIASGALASGVGYALWYAALKHLQSATAATVQLAVPAIAAAGGMLLLSEPFAPQLLIAFVAILGGMALVIFCKPKPA